MTVFILLFYIVLYSLPAMAGMAILGYYLQGKYPKTSVGWLTLAGVPLTLMFFWGQTTYYNFEVDRLCAIDGGIKVYEQVILPASKFNKWGQVAIPNKVTAKPEDLYFYDSQVTLVPNTGGRVSRTKAIVHTKLENKILGEAVYYLRVGGDLPSPMHESSYTCPKKTDVVDLSEHIFKRSN